MEPPPTDDTHDAAAMVRHAHVAKPAPTETDAHDAATAVVIHSCLTSFVEAHSAIDLDAVMYVGVEIEPRKPPSQASLNQPCTLANAPFANPLVQKRSIFVRTLGRDRPLR